MNNFKQVLVALVLAISMALPFAAVASADSPRPAGNVPAGTVTFFVNGTPSIASFNPYEIAVAEKVPVTSPKPGSGVPTGTVTFTIDGPQMQGQHGYIDWTFTYQKIPTVDQAVQYDNEWKYVPIRR